ncbi:MAG: hypothetical protein QOG73_714 [Acetobacteraceae bacterium]|nr:hypothetical protein [Acetobacteraceae bacterium]
MHTTSQLAPNALSSNALSSNALSSNVRYAIAIVGGGFSGVMTAVQLLRVLPAPHAVVLFERSDRFARGQAYATGLPCHLLNVAAARMSAFPDSPADFADWLNHTGAESACAATEAGLFAPRKVYGDYIESIAQVALRSGRLVVVRASVTDLQPERDGVRLTTAEGLILRASRVVLALGNLALGNPATGENGTSHVCDPWSTAALAPIDPISGDPVVVIGTGLTMVDLMLGLRARGYAGPIVAISRRGQLPHRHCPAPNWPAPDFTARERRSVAALCRRVRAEAAAAASANVDWRGVIDALRPAVQSLWQGMPSAERRRFLRHLRPWWDVHRHRMPAPAAEAVRAERDAGSLRIHAGTILSAEPCDGGVLVNWRPRGDVAAQSTQAVRVFDATGASNAAGSPDRLLGALRRRGVGRLDCQGLGLDVSPTLNLLDSMGRPNPRIHALGPIMRGVLWECTAVPELRTQAQAVARHVAAALSTSVPA